MALPPYPTISGIRKFLPCLIPCNLPLLLAQEQSVELNPLQQFCISSSARNCLSSQTGSSSSCLLPSSCCWYLCCRSSWATSWPAVRMREYGLKIGVIFFSLILGLFVLTRAFDFKEGRFDIPLGVDLKGGVILIYEINEVTDTADGSERKIRTAASQPRIPMSDLVQRLYQPDQPSGTKEIVIRPYGERQIEIIIPEVDPRKKLTRSSGRFQTAGQLGFPDRCQYRVITPRSLTLPKLRRKARQRDSRNVSSSTVRMTRVNGEGTDWTLGRGGQRETQGGRG